MNEFSGLAAHMAHAEIVQKNILMRRQSDGSPKQELFLNAAARKQSHWLFHGQPG